MNKKSVFSPHILCISGLFVIGSAVITLPSKVADRYTLTAFLTTAIISVLIFLIVTPIANLFFTDISSLKKSLPLSLGAIILYLSVAVFSLFCFADTFKTFVRFASDLMFKGGALPIAVMLFGGLILFFVSRRQEDILKFALLSFIGLLITVIFFFLASMGDFEPENILIFRLPSFTELWKNAKPYLKEISIPIILLPIYRAMIFDKERKTLSLMGVISGYILLGLCLSSAVMLFGSNFAGQIEYPYAAAVSTVSIGRLFTRMDYFSYFIYFVSAVARVNVCLFTVRESLKRISVLTKNSIKQPEKD